MYRDKDLHFHSVDLLDQIYCIRTKADLVHESITNTKATIVQQYESNLVEYFSGSVEPSSYYCKVCSLLLIINRFARELYTRVVYCYVVVVRNHIMRNVAILPKRKDRYVS